MAIDPSISLNVRPPVIPVPDIQTPLERFAKVLSLRNLMTQGESGQIGLQTQQLQLQQMQREAEERQRLAAFLAQTRGAASQPLTPAPEAAAPTIPPVQPTPPGGTVAQTAPATIAPNFGLPTAPAPAGPVSNLMTPPPAAASGPTIGGISYGEFLTRFPTIGPGMLKTHLELEKAQTETDIKHNDAQKQKWEAMAGAAQAVQASKNPEAEFKTQLMDLYNAGHITAQELAALRDHGYDPAKMQGWKDRAVSQTDFHTILKTDAETLSKTRANFALAMRNVNDQAGYDRIFPGLPADLQKELGPTYSPQLKAVTSAWDIPSADLPKTQAAQQAADAQALAPLLARKDGGAAAQAYLAKIGTDRAAPFVGKTTPQEVMRAGLTSEQATTAAQAAATAAETGRHNLSTESTAKLNAAIAAGRLQQERIINGMKYGPDTQQFWVQQIKDNPDSIKEMPPEFRSSVGQMFRQATGLPLPTPLGESAKEQERLARTALDGVDFIRQALKNPEIAKQIGPLMGNLGSVEQRVGTAVGLSPEAEALGQELRTRMRYFVLQEGRAIAGRSQKLIGELEKSSASPKMDADMLKGALDAAEGAAQSILDNNDKQRFGGKMRSRQDRGIAPPPAPAAAPPKVGDVVPGKGGQKYMFIGGDPKDKNNYKPWTPVAQ